MLCDYVVTLEDAKNCARFPDVVARRYGAVDQAGLADGEGERPTMQSGYDFPYRALLAQGLEGCSSPAGAGPTRTWALPRARAWAT